MSETAESTTTVTAKAGGSRGVKRGLPTTGLPAAEDAAQKLWTVARLGSASQEAFARQFGSRAKASGGTWKTRLALLRGFDLIRVEGIQVKLSDLGRKLVNSSDPAAQVKARQTAILHLKAYRELIDSFNGTTLPDATVLATRLQFDYGKQQDFATKAAEAFVESLRHAHMIGDDGLVHKDGAPSTTPAPASDESPEYDTGDLADTDEEARAEEIEIAFQEEQDEEGLSSGEDDDTSSVDPSASVVSRSVNTHQLTLSVTLDLSNFRTEDVIRILAALGISHDDH